MFARLHRQERCEPFAELFMWNVDAVSRDVVAAISGRIREERFQWDCGVRHDVSPSKTLSFPIRSGLEKNGTTPRKESCRQATKTVE